MPTPTRATLITRASSITIGALTAAAAAQPCEWSPFGDGLGVMVHAVTVFDDGAGPAVYAGLSGQGVARWNGSTWTAVGGFSAGTVTELATFDDGAGAALYAGGAFTAAGATPANRIARWDGQQWSALGDGVNLNVGALATFDDGAGEALFVAGNFTSAGGIPANRIARWDGQSWSALDSGLSGGFFANVNALAAFNGALYAGGLFTTAGVSPAMNIARWDPVAQEWSIVASGTDGIVISMAVYDDGSGPSLIVGGRFDTAGGLPASRIARWDGELWLPLGIGIGPSGGPIPPAVNALAVLAEGGRDVLYVGGEFALAGGLPVGNIARWEGDSVGWSALESDLSGLVNDFAVDQSALIAGGAFTSAGGNPAARIARWSCHTPGQCYANCDASTIEPVLNVDDFTCFINEFAAAQALPHQAQVEHVANCDQSTIAPVLNVDDFTCFINLFAQGCP